MERGDEAKEPDRLPVVLTPDEVTALLDQMDGTNGLVAYLLYGAGLRILEALRLRVKDLDFDYGQITVRQSKGKKNRRTTRVYTHVLQDGSAGTQSPLAALA